MLIGIASADYLRADRSTTGQDAWGGAGYARMGQYVPFYEAAGHTVVCGTLWREEHGVAVEDANKVKVYPDVILLQRLMHEGVADAMRWGQANGQKFINDLDDWYWGLDPNNEAFKGSHPKTKIPKVNLMGQVYHESNPENINFYGPNLAASDVLTVSTPYLAERISRKVRCPIVCIPNYIDVLRFNPVVQSCGTPLFGWVGSTSHRSGDIETVAGVMRPRIMDSTIRMHHSGDYEQSPKLAGMLGVPEHMVSTTPRSTAQDYPKLLTFDVGIVPLRETPFNFAKSDIKGLEYAASGIPFIAQDTPSYRKLWEDWEGAFWLARRPKDWQNGIKHYLDYETRCKASRELLGRAVERDIYVGSRRWIELLEGMK